jgi:hypothetical protein
MWKACVTGGIIFPEIKRSKDGKYWHPHLHLMVQGRYIDHNTLSRVWRACTGDSYIVDVRLARSENELAAYVAKYVAKPAVDAIIDQPDLLDEFVLAIKGLRLAQPFGTWYHWDLSAPQADPGDWSPCGSLAKILADARDQQPYALGILRALHAPEEFLAPGLFDQDEHDTEFW